MYDPRDSSYYISCFGPLCNIYDAFIHAYIKPSISQFMAVIYSS
jgi:hypothetical protein